MACMLFLEEKKYEFIITCYRLFLKKSTHTHCDIAIKYGKVRSNPIMIVKARYGVEQHYLNSGIAYIKNISSFSF